MSWCRLSCITLLLLAVSGCGTAPTTKQEKLQQPTTPEQMIQQAASAAPQEKGKLLVTAASLYHQQQQYQRVLDTFKLLQPQTLNSELQGEYFYLLSDSQLNLGQLDAAIETLYTASTYQLNHEHAQKLVFMRSTLLYQQGNYLESAQTLIDLESTVGTERTGETESTDGSTKQDNQTLSAIHRQIWLALGNLSEETLRLFKIDPPPNVTSGWLELAILFKEFQGEPSRLMQGIKRWQKQYPAHPANDHFPSDVANYAQAEIVIPRQVAILLPYTSQHATAVQSIHDGFMGAYFDAKTELDKPPVIRAYDTGKVTSKEQMHALYQQAIIDGADVVVGPLLKSNIERLQDLPQIIPTIVLNQLDSDDSSDELFYFSLAPEHELASIQAYAKKEGLKRAAIMAPDNEWGQRIIRSYTETWGKDYQVTAVELYQEDKLRENVINLFNIENSKARYREMQRILGMNLEFMPRRRKDIDYIVLAADKKVARQFNPLFSYYFARDIPVFGTSKINDELHFPELDKDLDGIRFVDIPAILNEQEHIPDYWGAKDYPTQRLIAFGYDAYQLLLSRNFFEHIPDYSIKGKTGVLEIDDQNILVRQPSWAIYQDGIAKEVDVNDENISIQEDGE